MSLYDPGPLIALSSLGTAGFRRPYITPPRLPELRVFAAEVLTVGLSMNRGHTLPNSNLPSTVFQTFGCLWTSGSNAGWGRWSQHYFLLISSNNVPSSDRTPGWPSCVCVCVFVRRLCLHTTTAVHTVPVSAHKLPPRRFFFFFPRAHQRPGVRAQGQQLSIYSWITSRNVTLTTFMRYAQSRALSNSPPQLCQNEGWMTVTHLSDLSGTIKQMLPQDRQEASDHTSHCRPKAWTITASNNGGREPVNVEQTL